jgi:hypothetical protein
MTTAGDIINRALKDAGVIAAGETAPAEDAVDALMALNDIIIQWQALPGCVPKAPYELTTFASQADVLNLPALYEPALRYSLAEVLPTVFSLPVRPDIIRLAVQARKVLKRAQLVIPDSQMPCALQFGRRLGTCCGDE